MVDWLEKSASETLQQVPEKLEYFSDSHVAWENTLRAAKVSSYYPNSIWLSQTQH